jgi:hypothetical protein
MESQTRALPHEDLEALLSVVAELHGYLLLDELPTELTQHLIHDLRERRLLPEGATPGSLNALFSDLEQRLHWAMNPEMEYPAPDLRRTRYQLKVPAESVAACVAALEEAGGQDIHDGPPTTTGWTMLPTGPDGALERHSTDVPHGRTVTVVFPELAPDPAYHDRIVQLSALAERHGGHYDGSGGL